MSQEEVLEVLKEEKLATAEEIAKLIGISVIAVRYSLNKMLDEDVERIIIHKKYSMKSYAWKIINSKISEEKFKKYK